MNRDYSIWELYCTPNSIIPCSQISESKIVANTNGQEVNQSALENITAETIEIGNIHQSVNTYNYLNGEDKRFNNLSSESLLKLVDDFPKLSFNLNATIDLFYRNHILILGGDHEDKVYLARFLAKEISDRANINDKTKVFLIYKMMPKNVNNDLSQLQEATQNQKNFVIVTTDIPKAKWEGVVSYTHYWWQPESKSIYRQSSLRDNLWEKLNGNIQLFLQKSIADLPSSDLTDEGITQVKDYLLGQLAEKNIFTLAEVNNCAKNLNQLNIDEDINKDNIADRFVLANNQRDNLKKWYKTYLTPREQLLAIGLSLFDGLFEDQFFAALERVVKDVWQERDASLKALDYGDLINLSNHFDSIKSIFEADQFNKFKFVQTQEVENEFLLSQLKLNNPDDRRLLFEVAWDSHRRQILTTLPTLVNLIKESVQSNAFNWELSGGIRHAQLHSVVIETISDLGLVSKNTTGKVQEALLDLAAQTEIDIQDVAARAIKRWHQYGGEKQLFTTLQLFYGFTINSQIELAKASKNSYSPKIEKKQKLIFVVLEYVSKIIIGVFQSLFSKSVKKEPKSIRQYNDYVGDTNFLLHIQKLTNEFYFKNCLNTSEFILFGISKYRRFCENPEKPLIRGDCIGATVALVVGYAAKDDYQNEKRLRNEFFNWLKELSESSFPLVHIYFGYHTLFHLLPLCLVERKDWLKEIAQKHTDFLNHAIALSLANAYNIDSNQEIIRQLLNEWERESSPSNKLKKLSKKQEALKITLVFTYGLIEYPNSGQLTAKQAFAKLATILNNRPLSSIRSAVIYSICTLAFRYFNIVESQLQNLVENFKLDEPEKLVQVLTNVYLEQRANLLGGDDEIEINGRFYRIWTNSERPLTNIETVMYRWVRGIESELPQEQEHQKGNKKAAQKIALAAFTSFAINLDQEEEHYIQELEGEINHAE
jgi:hypothetical protein